MLRRKSLATDTVMAAPLHWTEMAPVGTAGAVFGAVELVAVAALALVGTAVVDSQEKPAAAVEAALEASEGAEVAELPDAAAVVTSVASADLEWSHAGLSVEDEGGVRVVPSAVKHSVSVRVPSICSKNARRVIFPPTLTGSSGPFWVVVFKSFQTSASVRRPCVCARGPQGTVVVPRSAFIKI